MNKQKTKFFWIVMVLVLVGIAVLFLLIYAQCYVLKPQHGMGRMSPGKDAAYYDSDKKKWVSEAEWLRKYTELPIGYLSKEEWDKKKRNNQ
ncbi:MAG: hypothetical protein WCI77_07715 [Candidatus Omnitrophota bacterium]